MTLSDVKDLSTIIGLALLAWRGIIFLHEAGKTAKAIPVFMTETTAGLNQIRNHVEVGVNNHLTHMEAGITELAVSQRAQTSSLDQFRERLSDFLLDMSNKQAVILENVRAE